MSFTVPDIENITNGTNGYDGQAARDSTDDAAIAAIAFNTGVLNTLLPAPSQVTQNTGSDMNVLVPSLTVAIAGTTYLIPPSGALAIPSASATDRRDIVIWALNAASVGGSTTAYTSNVTGAPASGYCVITGTACGTAGWTRASNPSTNPPPVKANIPTNSVLLAEVYVVNSTTAITTTLNIVDKMVLIAPNQINGSSLALWRTAR